MAHSRQKRIIRQCNALGMGKVVADIVGKSVIRHFDESTKRQIVNDLYGEAARVMLSERGKVEMREKIAGLAFEYASLQVLCTKDNDLDLGPFKCNELSAELHNHIRAAVPACKELQEIVGKHENLSDTELVDACSTRCAVILLHLNSFNVLRAVYKDIDTDKDWFRPFVRSMLIWNEDSYRKKLGLPSLLKGELDGLKHSTFMNMVTNGHRNPLFEWETAYPDLVNGIGQHS